MAQHDAYKCRDAFATAKAQPDREHVAEDDRQRGEIRHIRAEIDERQPDREESFGAIEQQGQGTGALAAETQYVCGADIAGAFLANIAGAGEPGDDQAKRDRPEQVRAGDPRCEHRPAIDDVFPVGDVERRLKA